MDELLDLDASTLPTSERSVRLAEFDALYREHVRNVERTADTARIRLSGAPGLTDRVRETWRRAKLIAALDAGGDDLQMCAHTDCCPIPFADLR